MRSPQEIDNLLTQLFMSLELMDPVVSARCGVAEPPDYMKRDGKLAYADGTNWNPGGTGKGYYRWDADTSAWVKIG